MLGAWKLRLNKMRQFGRPLAMPEKAAVPRQSPNIAWSVHSQQKLQPAIQKAKNTSWKKKKNEATCTIRTALNCSVAACKNIPVNKSEPSKNSFTYRI